ncbi:PH domain-containing protein [Streptomyces lunaelactis]|uniref:PH domain-containing protein n=1 Tax=Streptomyces lunaelactis TaxID=1535768 RepID=UPI00158480A0|nr:PH domain-containing protein [Streptomyces lunaelactis]NUK03941.1 PH domain-containing protein [Streptomyces lunaelactis]NUK18445.1 PH domain-containing protein [Streptomyces lunaelactis]
MDTVTGGKTLRLRLRRQVEWVPVAALVLAVVWGIAVGTVVEGPNGTAGGIAMSVVGVPIAVLAVSGAGHLVRPLRVRADAEGLTVRLPTWPGRTVPWSAISRVSASPRYVVVEGRAPVGKLPRTCRLRAAYRRLAASEGSDTGEGLCFETQVFDLDPAELLDAIRQYAPVGLTVTDETRQ